MLSISLGSTGLSQVWTWSLSFSPFMPCHFFYHLHLANWIPVISLLMAGHTSMNCISFVMIIAHWFVQISLSLNLQYDTITHENHRPKTWHTLSRFITVEIHVCHLIKPNCQQYNAMNSHLAIMRCSSHYSLSVDLESKNAAEFNNPLLYHPLSVSGKKIPVKVSTRFWVLPWIPYRCEYNQEAKLFSHNLPTLMSMTTMMINVIHMMVVMTFTYFQLLYIGPAMFAPSLALEAGTHMDSVTPIALN